MKVLVTGATGFLGSHIVDHSFRQNDSVRVLVRKTSNRDYLKRYPELEYVTGDLLDIDALKKAVEGVDIVYHSAARATDWGSRRQFMEANYTGSKNVLEACLGAKVKRLVYISSPGVVFDFKDQEMIDESYPYPEKPGNFYAEFKARAEKLILQANGKSGLTTVSLRPHAIWGPRDVSGFFPRFVRMLKERRLKDFTGGKTVLLDMCHVTNAADACILAGRSDKAAGKAYFITDGQTVDSWKFLDRVADLFEIPRLDKKLNLRFAKLTASIFEIIWRIPRLAENHPPPITRYALEMMTHSTTYSIDAAKRDLGYSPGVSVDKGLALLKKWIDGNGGVDGFIRSAR
ncbi:MAG: NAD-dependent epimerase/dehydratase family protein [Desulfobacteraceae bacterium]|nr:NAD-dependent epimerase/dehydratase family protein [Desulfobacteraceae bacterium]